MNNEQFIKELNRDLVSAKEELKSHNEDIVKELNNYKKMFDDEMIREEHKTVNPLFNNAEEDEAILEAAQTKKFVIIVNKQDLDITENLELLQNRFGKEKVMPLSAKTNAGIEVFASWLKNYVYGSEGSLGDGVYVQNARQENLLRQAQQSLLDAAGAAESYLPYDCIVIDVRTAIDYSVHF